MTLLCVDRDFTLRGPCLYSAWTVSPLSNESLLHRRSHPCREHKSPPHPPSTPEVWIPLLSWGPESSSQNLRTRAHLLPSFLFALLRAKQGPLQLFSGFPAMARGKPGHLEPRPWTWRDSPISHGICGKSGHRLKPRDGVMLMLTAVPVTLT